MQIYKFLSPEWLVETEKIIRSRITPETINYASTSVLTTFENCPDGTEKALFFQVTKGTLTEISLHKSPYPEVEFAINGEYVTFVKIFRGELEPSAALMTGELNFQGNLLRAMGMISLIEPFYKVLAEIPAVFE